MSGSCFLELPVDLLIDILCILDPNDIISIRRTCNILAELGRKRSVWINAYRRVSEPNGLLASTYPFEDMTTADLEFSSTATARFLNRIRRDSADCSDCLSYVSEKRLTHPSPDEAFSNHALVPGGRYLLTRSTNERVHLWDLGVHPLSPVNKIPVASLRVPSGGEYDMRLIQWTADRRGIRLFLRVPIGQESLRFECYEIYPRSPNPSFRLATKLTVQSPEWATPFWPAENYLIFQQANVLTLWDMDTDRWAKVDAGGSAKQLDFCSGNIVVLHDNGMTISKIPPLHPRLPDAFEAPTDPSAATNSPVIHVPFRTSLPHLPVLSTAAVSFHWRPYAASEGLDYFIDLFVEGGGGPQVDQEGLRGGCEVQHYRYQPTPSLAPESSPSPEGSDAGPSHIPVCLAHTPLPNTTWRDLGMAKSVWITNEDVIYFWQDGTHVKVGTTRVMGDGQADCVLKTVLLDDFDVEYEACPFLGRVCVRSEAPSREIAILDFLEGPPLD